MIVRRLKLALTGFLVFLVFLSLSPQRGVSQDSPLIDGVLKIHPQNPRYFTDNSGRAIYLTGSHSWFSLIDKSESNPPQGFDYTGYLDFLQEHHHNFIRLWYAEFIRGDDSYITGPVKHYIGPHPWQRTGPGEAVDGLPKFDLEHFNEDYFQRLRERVVAAKERNIYVSIMLFEGWGLQFAKMKDAHPFDRDNNVNEVHYGEEITDLHTLTNPEVTALQEAYIYKVIDSVNDLDNVMYEIANEAGAYSAQWQYHMIEQIKNYQATKPKQHLIGMTFQHPDGNNETLFESPADWISPGKQGGYRDNPPVADGNKIVISDTDHLWGSGGGDATWVWKSFARGYHTIYMDWLQTKRYHEESEEIRLAMGQTRLYAERLNLATMLPQPDLSSSHYLLASPDEYFVYLPKGREVTLDMTASSGSFTVEWFDTEQAVTQQGESVTAGESVTLQSPFGKRGAALYLRSVSLP